MYDNESPAGTVDPDFMRRRAMETQANARVAESEGYARKEPWAESTAKQASIKAATLIQVRISELERRASNLRDLLNALPRELPYSAELALFELLIKDQR